MLIGLVGVGVVGLGAFKSLYKIVVRTEYHPHQSKVRFEVKDDDATLLRATFNPDHVDRRRLDQWEVNSSGATLRLDCPDIRVDRKPEFDILYPSYTDALNALPKYSDEFLPSANLIDGTAKQFDDGLYAAIDVALYTGRLKQQLSPRDWVQRVIEKLPPKSEAKAFLAAAIELAGGEIAIDDSLQTMQADYLRQFNQDELRNKPIGFYTWNDDLKWIWRFSKFLQTKFTDPKIPNQIVAVLEAEQELSDAYQQLCRHANQMSNPAVCLNLSQLAPGKSLLVLASQYGVGDEAVAVFPASESKETTLFTRLFANGVPDNANLMSALIERILSGNVDLAPRPNSGWYDHQVYALETLLIPANGRENDKLLLTARYKKRLLEAFKSVITKRRETHARQTEYAKLAAMAPRPSSIQPRLRVEPSATYFLRTARAYRFVVNFLEAALHHDDLQNLVGLRENGDRGQSIGDELLEMQNRFYGLYLVVCDDIGMVPQFAAQENVDQDACYQLACRWLNQIKENPDLAKDTRVSVPVAYDIGKSRTRLWATLGVRFAYLDVNYVTPPLIRIPGEASWQKVEVHEAENKRYVIAVDEWAELDCDGRRSFTRSQFRKLCDKYQTRDAIVAAMK